MPADVLAYDEQIALRGEQSGGVQSTGAVEHLLLFAQCVREGSEYFVRDGSGVCCGGVAGFRADCVEGGFAADAAGGCGVEVALYTGRGWRDVRGEGQVEDVVRVGAGVVEGIAVAGQPDVVGGADDAFGVEESGGPVRGRGLGYASLLPRVCC
ncbi:hypothetical protein GCM10009804_62970 [Kribbella hippodromi]|uniref:Uncharacterized protein n=1 Tax=Kribbella hippodromi TaxID=434347 RepID=A0ABP4Q4Z3_9ACTN